MTTRVASNVLANTAVTPGVYGGTSNVAVITIDQQGRITSASNVSGSSLVAGSTIMEYNQTISSNYTITTNKNALSAGPITISDGVTVTVPDGSNWTIV
jgi:hypothetical protein